VAPLIREGRESLRLWRLDQNGFGNKYYSAGVRSMSLSWHNFFYTSFDPAGFMSIDKPPVASAKLFGFDALSLLIPQALEGVAAVALLYHLVQRVFGAAAGLLAALFLALTPVSVAIDRSSNTDTCLALVLLLAAWALTHAVERGSLPLLALAMALVGLGFNVKMLAAFVVLPTFAVVYFVGAPLAWRRTPPALSRSRRASRGVLAGPPGQVFREGRRLHLGTGHCRGRRSVG
jgi:4-amino-4-deoxy-L-arabinose transferase-like glycosyltransferase